MREGNDGADDDDEKKGKEKMLDMKESVCLCVPN